MFGDKPSDYCKHEIWRLQLRDHNIVCECGTNLTGRVGNDAETQLFLDILKDQNKRIAELERSNTVLGGLVSVVAHEQEACQPIAAADPVLLLEMHCVSSEVRSVGAMGCLKQNVFLTTKPDKDGSDKDGVAVTTVTIETFILKPETRAHHFKPGRYKVVIALDAAAEIRLRDAKTSDRST